MGKKIFKKISLFFPFLIILILVAFLGYTKKNKKIKLSIVIPVYNVEDYVAKCLDSLINQTYSNLEIICVNDGSTDNSLKILNRYKEKDKRIIVIDKPNGGVSSARNTGIDVSNGEYITFVDSDDYIDTDAYENCLKIIKEKDADVLAFGYIVEPEHVVNNRFKQDKYYTRFECFKNEFNSNSSVWNKIFRTNIIKNNHIRFAEDVSYAEDSLFLKMVFPHTKIVLASPNSYYHYVQRDSSIEQTYSYEKRLISKINYCYHLVKYYTDNQYDEAYIDVLDSCLEVYDIIHNFEYNKRKYYAEQILKILDEMLLPKINTSLAGNRLDNIKKLNDFTK